MNEQAETITVHANVDITVTALQSIVENAKKIVGPDERGRFQVDTAEMVSRMITSFLAEKNFEAYVAEIQNFPASIK